MVKMTALDAMEARNPELWSQPARAHAVDPFGQTISPALSENGRWA